MSGIDGLLRHCLEAPSEDGRRSLFFPATLQGFPDTVHGGGVLAVLDLMACQWLDRTTPRLIAAEIRRSVPLETPLTLAARLSDPGVVLTLDREGRSLATGNVCPAPPAPAPAWDGWSGLAGGFDLPVSRGCLACGAENPSGLQARLCFDNRWVWSRYEPRETYRTADGRLAPALFTVLLDELAWWLGALTCGEAGVSSDLRITLERPDHPFGEPVLALGRRDRVAVIDRKGHFWKTEAEIFTLGGERLASALITFAASHAYSRKLIPVLLLANSPESLRRVFPRYVA